MSLMLSDGIVNQLLVTNSAEANQELTKLHEQLFNRTSLLHALRRQTAIANFLSPQASPSLPLSGAVKPSPPPSRLLVLRWRSPSSASTCPPSSTSSTPPLPSLPPFPMY